MNVNIKCNPYSGFVLNRYRYFRTGAQDIRNRLNGINTIKEQQNTEYNGPHILIR